MPGCVITCQERSQPGLILQPHATDFQSGADGVVTPQGGNIVARLENDLERLFRKRAPTGSAPLSLGEPERGGPPTPRAHANLGATLKDAGIHGSVHLFALCETEVRLEVVLHAAQRAQAYAEQVHPAGGFRRIL
jgi:hypothetical protein